MVRRLLTPLLLVVCALTGTAQMPDPSTLPRLELTDIEHLGGFRAPQESSNDQNFKYAGTALAHNPSTNTLYLTNLSMNVAEITIPAFVKSADPSQLPAATFVQGFRDPTEGHRREIKADLLGSLIVVNNKLCGTVYVYYDADPSKRMKVSHYCRSLQLDVPSFSGWSAIAHPHGSGFVSGWMTHVPAEWQSRLGGPALTGQCCIPIVTRTSFGMSAAAFDPAQIGRPRVPASPLLYYTEDNATLGGWESSSPTYGSSTEMGGLAIIPGTRTVLYVGMNGLGPYCYGPGTGDKSLVGKKGPEGAYCHDPTSPYKGVHAYPYRSQIWAYDLNDFAAVKAGRKRPWAVVPYGVWPLEFPTPQEAKKIGGVSYDAQRQILYVSQLKADRPGPDNYNGPVVHGLKINIGAPPAPGPAAAGAHKYPPAVAVPQYERATGLAPSSN